MKITSPKWVKKANQWCVTSIEALDGKSSKHAVRQTQHWFSTEEEAIAKQHELTAKNNEPKDGKIN